MLICLWRQLWVKMPMPRPFRKSSAMTDGSAPLRGAYVHMKKHRGISGYDMSATDLMVWPWCLAGCACGVICFPRSASLVGSVALDSHDACWWHCLRGSIRFEGLVEHPGRREQFGCQGMCICVACGTLGIATSADPAIARAARVQPAMPSRLFEKRV